MATGFISTVFFFCFSWGKTEHALSKYTRAHFVAVRADAQTALFATTVVDTNGKYNISQPKKNSFGNSIAQYGSLQAIALNGNGRVIVKRWHAHFSGPPSVIGWGRLK